MTRIDTMISSVLRRPLMYTLDGTFEEVVAFLAGYSSGSLTADRIREPSAETWQDFERFLVSRLGGGIPTSTVLREFRRRHTKGSLRELGLAYTEFRDCQTET